MNRFDRRCHDISNENLHGITSLRNDAEHQVAFAEHADKAMMLSDCDGSDAFLIHNAHRIHNGRIRAYRHEWRSGNSQETHTYTSGRTFLIGWAILSHLFLFCTTIRIWL